MWLEREERGEGRGFRRGEGGRGSFARGINRFCKPRAQRADDRTCQYVRDAYM